MDLLGPFARWIHLGACVGLVGVAGFVLLAGRSELGAAAAWQRQMLRWSRGLVLAAIAGGILALGHQTALFHGGAPDVAAVGRALFETQLGIVWLGRHAALLLLAGVLFARLETSRAADWFAMRAQTFVLSLVALASFAGSGHAVAVEPGTKEAVAVAVAHLIATGIWVGGLPALAALLCTTTLDLYVARATWRFSQAALLSVLLLAGTGMWNALSHIGSVPALVGTPYGQMLLLKLALLGVILVLAARARRRLVPALLRGTRAAFGSLRRVALAEASLAAGILLIVAVMGMTKPARHEQPTWPFAFRFVSSAQAVVRANPATYARPTVAYSASSIVTGATLYEAHCAGCHGEFRAAVLARHTAGDLFWLSRHARGSLTPEERWHVVNYLRTIEASQLAQPVVAPDFTFAVGPIPPQALRDFRGRRMVYLIIYSLPESTERVREIARVIDALDLQGVEIIAVPTDASPDAIRRLGGARGLYFSIVTDGAAEIVAAYRLLARSASHAEFLIDRQGTMRGRWAGREAAPPLASVLEQVQRLARELPAPPVAEHIH